MAKRRIDMSEQPGAGGFSNPFTSLQEDLPDLPGPTPASQSTPGNDEPSRPRLLRQRAVGRLERKNHGGDGPRLWSWLFDWLFLQEQPIEVPPDPVLQKPCSIE